MATDGLLMQVTMAIYGLLMQVTMVLSILTSGVFWPQYLRDWFSVMIRLNYCMSSKTDHIECEVNIIVVMKHNHDNL